MQLSQMLDPRGLRLEMPQLSFPHPVQVSALFYKDRNTVVVAVSAKSDIDLVCDRCLSVYHRPYDEHFDLDYTVRDQVSLDVTDDIRQEIILSCPVRTVCREDCRGLCPQCGANLNEGLCQHASTQA